MGGGVEWLGVGVGVGGARPDVGGPSAALCSDILYTHYTHYLNPLHPLPDSPITHAHYYPLHPAPPARR